MLRKSIVMVLCFMFALILTSQGALAYTVTYDAGLGLMPNATAPAWVHTKDCYTDYAQICDGSNSAEVNVTNSSPDIPVLVIDTLPIGDGFTSRGLFNFFSQECDGPVVAPESPFVIEAKLKVIDNSTLELPRSSIGLLFSPFPGEYNVLFIDTTELFLLSDASNVGISKNGVITDDDYHVYRVEVGSDRLIDVYMDGSIMIDGYDKYLPIASVKQLVRFGDLTSSEHGRTEWVYVKHNACGYESNITANYTHMLARNTDANVIGWGRNVYGMLSDGNHGSNDPVAPYVTAIDGTSQNLTSMDSVGGAMYHSASLKSDGTLWAWGSNNHGQLGRGYANLYEPLAARIELDDSGSAFDGIMSFASGSEHMIALKEDGTVWAWGNNAYGQLGIGSRDEKLSPVQVPGLDHIVAISADGGNHSLALRFDGSVYAWGNNAKGQIGCGATCVQQTGYDNGDILLPYKVVNPPADPADIAVSLGTGYWTSFTILNSGGYLAWGDNWAGQLGLGTAAPSTVTSPMNQVTPVSESKVISIDSAHAFSIVLLDNGEVWGAGRNSYGALGNDIADNEIRYDLFKITLPGSTPPFIKEISAAYKYSAVLTEAGDVITWGINDYGQLGRYPSSGNYDPVPTKVLGLPVIGH